MYDPTRAYRLLTAAVRSYHPSICPAIQSIGSVDQLVNLSVCWSVDQSLSHSVAQSVLGQSVTQSVTQSANPSVNPSNQSGSGPFPPRLAAAPALFPGFLVHAPTTMLTVAVMVVIYINSNWGRCTELYMCEPNQSSDDGDV